MPEFTQFENENHIVIPAIAEKIYDKYWIRLLTISAPSPQQQAKLYVEFKPCRDILDANGNIIDKELKEPEVSGDIKLIEVDDLFALAGENQLFAQAMEYVFQALKTLAFPEQTQPTE